MGHTLAVFPWAKLEANRQVKGKLHTNGDRFAVNKGIAVSGFGLKSMSKSMTKIEERPRSGFFFIGADDGRLCPATSDHGLLAQGLISFTQGGAIFFKNKSGNNAELADLG